MTSGEFFRKGDTEKTHTTSFLFAQQRPYLRRRQFPHLSRLQAFVSDGTDAGAAQTNNGVRDGVTHLADLAVATLADGDLHSRP